MPTPLPGMDPYPQRRELWKDVHTRLLVAISDILAPLVRPSYRVVVEQRTYLAIIELLSHSNKALQHGRKQFERKRRAMLASMTHPVEIDLLRAGEPLAMRVEGNGHRTDYRIVISRLQPAGRPASGRGRRSLGGATARSACT